MPSFASVGGGLLLPFFVPWVSPLTRGEPSLPTSMSDSSSAEEPTSTYALLRRGSPRDRSFLGGARRFLGGDGDSDESYLLALLFLRGRLSSSSHSRWSRRATPRRPPAWESSSSSVLVVLGVALILVLLLLLLVGRVGHVLVVVFVVEELARRRRGRDVVVVIIISEEVVDGLLLRRRRRRCVGGADAGRRAPGDGRRRRLRHGRRGIFLRYRWRRRRRRGGLPRAVRCRGRRGRRAGRALGEGGLGSLSGSAGFEFSIAAMASGALRWQFKSVSRLRIAGA